MRVGERELNLLGAALEMAIERLDSIETETENEDGSVVPNRVLGKIYGALFVLRSIQGALPDLQGVIESAVRGSSSRQLMELVEELMRLTGLPHHPNDIDLLAIEARQLRTKLEQGRSAVQAIMTTIDSGDKEVEVTDEFLNAWLEKMHTIQAFFEGVIEEVFEDREGLNVGYEDVIEWIQGVLHKKRDQGDHWSRVKEIFGNFFGSTVDDDMAEPLMKLLRGLHVLMESCPPIDFDLDSEVHPDEIALHIMKSPKPHRLLMRDRDSSPQGGSARYTHSLIVQFLAGDFPVPEDRYKMVEIGPVSYVAIELDEVMVRIGADEFCVAFYHGGAWRLSEAAVLRFGPMLGDGVGRKVLLNAEQLQELKYSVVKVSNSN